MRFPHLPNSLLVIIVTLAAIFLIPWRLVDWGKIETLPASTITVSGQAKSEEPTQIARFSVGVNSQGDTKDGVTNDVNAKVTNIIKAVKDFGIPDEDIKTQNISVYENQNQGAEVQTYPPIKMARWNANNTISIVLRDVTKASAFADLLNKTEANQVSGPSFSLDDTSAAEAKLLEEAINDARDKAIKVTEASGRRLGKVITVTEGAGSSPIYPLAESATRSNVPTPVEPGTQTVSKSVTVIFELL